MKKKKLFDKCQTLRYSGTMATKRIKTRELLRNFRTLKSLLVTGKIEHILIDIDGERDLELSLRSPPNSGANLVRRILAMPKPIRVRRTHIFDDFLRKRV